METSNVRAQDHESSARSNTTVQPVLGPEYGIYGHEQSIAGSFVRSEFTGVSQNKRSVSPAREVIIDYSGDATRIYIPPPAETGINVRIVPRVGDDQQTQPPSEPLHPDYMVDTQHNQLFSESSMQDPIGLFTQQRTGSDRKSTRLNSSHSGESRMPSSA